MYAVKRKQKPIKTNQPTWSLYSVYWGGGVFSGGYGGGNCQINCSAVAVLVVKIGSGSTMLLSIVTIAVVVVVKTVVCVQQPSPGVVVVVVVVVVETLFPGVAVCTTAGSGCCAFAWSSLFRNLLRTRRIAIMVPLLPTIFLYLMYNLVSFFATLVGIFRLFYGEFSNKSRILQGSQEKNVNLTKDDLKNDL